jgi:hypothetical protein
MAGLAARVCNSLMMAGGAVIEPATAPIQQHSKNVTPGSSNCPRSSFGRDWRVSLFGYNGKEIVPVRSNSIGHLRSRNA